VPIAPAPGPGGLLVPSSGALFGAWHKDPVAGGWTQQSLLDFEAMIGRKVGIDHHYYAWGDIPGSSPQWDLDNGRTPLISLGGDTTFPGFDAVNNGSQDAYIHSFAQRLKSYAKPLFFRPWYEMNGDWFPWDGTHNNTAGAYDGPAKLVQAWKRVHDIFVQEGATNVAWVWSPDAEDNPSAAWNHWANYYPGDAYVDWVGIDGYNWGTTQSWSSWQSFASIFAAVYADYATTKPIMVAETSSCDLGGDKGQWIAGASSSIKSQFPALKAVVWFDSNRNCNWRVDSSQSSLDAYRAMGADPYFNP
jgi:endoglucanase